MILKSSRAFAPLLAAVFALLTVSLKADWPQQKSDLKPEGKAVYGTLENGLRYVIFPNKVPMPGRASMRLYMNAGSLMEEDDQQGLAHFLEHMAFEGSSHVPNGELQKILQRHGFAFGADINAHTFTGDTVYELAAPKSDADSLDTTLFLLREVAENLTLAPGDVDHERGVILSELRTRDTPAVRLALKLRQVEAPGLLAADRLDIGGSPAIIGAATAADLRRFYDAWYRPELATLVVVGDFDVDAMEAKVRTEFGGWQARASAPAEPEWGQYKPAGERTLDFTDPGLTEGMMVTWVGPGDPRPDTTARETDNWEDRFLVYFFNKRVESRLLTPDTALLSASLGVSSDIHGIHELRLEIKPRPGQAKAAFEEAVGMLQSLRVNGLTQGEIDQFRTIIPTLQHQTTVQWQTESTASRTESFIRAFRGDAVNKDPAGGAATLETAQPHLMSPTEMAARTKSWFDADGPVFVRVTPGATDFDAAAMKADYDRLATQTAAAYTDTERKPWPYPVGSRDPIQPVTQSTDADFGYTHYVWPNGVVLNFKHTSFTAAQILINIDFPGGQTLFGPHPAVPPSLAQDILVRDGGLGKITYPDLQKTLQHFYWSVNYSLQPSATLLHGEARLGALPIELQVLQAYATDPALSTAAFDRLRAIAPELMTTMASTPHGAYTKAISHIFYNDDPRFDFSALSHMDTADLAAVQTMIRQSLGTGPITINMVGDIPEANAVKAVGMTFAALPARDAQAPAQAVPVDLTIHDHDITLHHEGPANQSLDVLRWVTPDCHDIRTVRELDVMAAIIRNRLFDTLREKDGADYSPGASEDCSYIYKGMGSFSILSTVKAGDDAVFRKATKVILDDLRDHPPSADEMTRATQPILAALDNEANSNTYWLSLMTNLDTLPGYRENALHKRADYQSITAEDIRQLARTWLRDDNMVHVRVLPDPAHAAPATAPVAPRATPAPDAAASH